MTFHARYYVHGEHANLLQLLIESGELPSRCWRRFLRRTYLDVGELRPWRESSTSWP
jgi:hypothetical protein